MNYEEFKNEVKDNIKDYLSEEYSDYEMRFDTIRRSGYTYEALSIRPRDAVSSVIPVLNISQAYENYQNGERMDAILEKLADIRMNAPIPGGVNKDMIFDYGWVKDKLYPRLVNTKASAEYLADKIHDEMEDLSIIYAVRVHEDSEGIADIVATADLAEMWGVSRDAIASQAMKNLESKAPHFCNIEEAIFAKGLSNGVSIEDMNPDNYDFQLYVLTNEQKAKGAAMAINPQVMDKIIAKLGDVYIIPSSVDETLIIPKDKVDDPQELVEIVKQVNESNVPPENQLSDNIYEYDPDTQSLKIAAGSQAEREGQEHGRGTENGSGPEVESSYHDSENYDFTEDGTPKIAM